MADPYELIVANQFNLPAIDAAAQQARRGRLAEMMLGKQMEQEAAQQQQLARVRAQATQQYQSGDTKGAKETAALGGDDELFRSLSNLDEEQAKALNERAQLIGQVAQWADTPDKWDRGIDFLAAAGHPDLAQYKGQFSPENRMAAIAGAGQLSEHLKQNNLINMAPGNIVFDPVTRQPVYAAPFAPRLQGFNPEQNVYETGGGDPYERILALEGGTDSNGNFRTSPKGALGPAQLMPGTAPEALQLAGLPPDAPWQTDPEVNKAAGKAYYEKQLQDFGDPVLAAAAYNAGPARVRDAVERGGQNWLAFVPAETQKYVQNFISGPKLVQKGTPKPADQEKPPAGYRWKEDGTLEAIPGGPADKPAQEEQEQAYSQSALDAFDRAIESAKRLKTHPGFGAAVGSGFDPQSWGSYSILPFTDRDTPFAGTDAADFTAELDALKAQVFLPMVQSMKGMGALSNAEGQKLTDAIGALNTNMSEAAFNKSLDRIIADLTVYRDRGRKTSSAQAPKANRVIDFSELP